MLGFGDPIARRRSPRAHLEQGHFEPLNRRVNIDTSKIRYIEIHSEFECRENTSPRSPRDAPRWPRVGTTVLTAALVFGRFFAHGDLRLVILNLIAEKPRHGYEIIKAIEDQVGGAYSPSPGVIYPTLTMLEELGHVAVSAGAGAKKLHAITADGQAYLAAYRPAVDALLARMEEASRVHGGGTAPQIFARWRT